MTRVLLLTTRRRIGPRQVDGWVAELNAPHLEASVVALTEPPARKRLPAARFLTVPLTTRPLSLPLEQPVRSRPTHVPRPAGAGRWRRAFEVRVGQRVDAALRRRRGDRLDEQRNAIFARGCVASREIRDLFASVDLVVALDADSTWAAWQLAQRHSGPDVVFGLSGAAWKLSEGNHL